MRVVWNETSRADWDRWTAPARAALHQDWAYGEAMSQLGGRPIRAVVYDEAAPIALAQFLVRDFVGLARAALCSSGPVWLAPLDDRAKAEVYRALRRTMPASRPRLTLFTPRDRSPGASLRRAGLKQVMTGASTSLVDLTLDLDDLRARLHQKWRNRLNAAERSTLKPVQNGIKPTQYRWLLHHESDQRARKKYKAPPISFAEAYQHARGGKAGVQIVRADLGRQEAAAMMFLTHGDCATYHIGWSSEAGRAMGAHNLILWNAFEQLKSSGVQELDLGGVNTKSGAGVARFKLGAGGELATFPGTFL